MTEEGGGASAVVSKPRAKAKAKAPEIVTALRAEMAAMKVEVGFAMETAVRTVSDRLAAAEEARAEVLTLQMFDRALHALGQPQLVAELSEVENQLSVSLEKLVVRTTNASCCAVSDGSLHVVVQGVKQGLLLSVRSLFAWALPKREKPLMEQYVQDERKRRKALRLAMRAARIEARKLAAAERRSGATAPQLQVVEQMA